MLRFLGHYVDGYVMQYKILIIFSTARVPPVAVWRGSEAHDEGVPDQHLHTQGEDQVSQAEAYTTAEPAER